MRKLTLNDKYYLPWTLRPEEEDRIDDQIADVRAVIEKEETIGGRRRSSESGTEDGDVDLREDRFVEQSLQGTTTSRKDDESRKEMVDTSEQDGGGKEPDDKNKQTANEGDENGDAHRPNGKVDGHEKPETTPEEKTENQPEEPATPTLGGDLTHNDNHIKPDEPDGEEADMDDGDGDEDAVIY